MQDLNRLTNTLEGASPKMQVVKFIYSEKATKLCENSTVDLTVTTLDKSNVEISQICVAFSEYMNFILLICKMALFTSKCISNSADTFTNSVTMSTRIFEKNEYCYLHEQYIRKKKFLEKHLA